MDIWKDEGKWRVIACYWHNGCLGQRVGPTLGCGRDVYDTMPRYAEGAHLYNIGHRVMDGEGKRCILRN